MPATSFTPSPAQKQHTRIQNGQRSVLDGLEEHKLNPDNTLNYDSTQVKPQELQDTQADLAHENWNNWADNLFMQARAEDIKVERPVVEIPLTVQAKPEEAVELLKDEAGYLEKRIDYDMAEVLDAKQQIAKSTEFLAYGSMPINAETMAEQSTVYRLPATETQPDIVAEETEQPEQSESDVIARNEETKQSQGLEPLIEDTHTREPQEFKQEVDLVRHHSDLDFLYFFGWLDGKFDGAADILDKSFLNTKQWVDTKTAIVDDLIFKQVFGFGEKKPLSKEAQEKQLKQAINKRMFFDALKTGASKLVTPDQRRNLRARIEAVNKSLKRGNLSYEGDLDPSGQFRESVLIDEERANSQKSEQQLKDEKKRKMMMATPSAVKKGPGISMTADKAHNFNNAAKLAG